MPIYEFECKSCDLIVSEQRKMGKTKPPPCPGCAGKMTLTMSKLGGFVLKGAGFFRNDYPRSK